MLNKNGYAVFSIILTTVILVGCITPRMNHKEGVILHGHKVYDSLHNEIESELFKYDSKIWFRDSTVIYQIGRTNINTDEDDKISMSESTDKFVFLDLRKMIFYDYKTFSDTSKMMRRYTLPDSAIVCWNFYKRKALVPFSNNLIKLSDTVIKNETYSRLKGEYSYYENTKMVKMVYTYFTKPVDTKSIFHVDRVFDETFTDCHAMRFEFYNKGFADIYSTYYEYISNTLTQNEKKIFDQWSKNAGDATIPINKLNNPNENR
jgi:hypothetical protein